MTKISLNTKIGPVSIEERDEKIVRVGWSEVAPERAVSPVLENAVDQLKAYFAEQLSEFDLPLAPPGSPFQQRVWSANVRNPTRRDVDVWSTCCPSRHRAEGSRQRLRRESDPDNHSLSSRSRRKWPRRILRSRRFKDQVGTVRPRKSQSTFALNARQTAFPSVTFALTDANIPVIRSGYIHT